MIRKDFIVRKVELIQSELAHLNAYASFSFDEIAADYVKQAVIERILERVINRAIDINQHLLSATQPDGSIAPTGYRDTFTALVRLGIYPAEFAEQIAKSIGTRNKLVHEYDAVDERQIYGSIKDCLTDYTTYCDYILKFLETETTH